MSRGEVDGAEAPGLLEPAWDELVERSLEVGAHGVVDLPG
jgi:hypothetical protein